MDYIFNFTLHLNDLPTDAFRLTYLDSQNDGTSQDVEFLIHCFSAVSYDISLWGLKKASLYHKENLMHAGLLTDGKAYEKDFDGYFYEFKIASSMALFKTRGPNRVFVDKRVDEIINEVFSSAGWTAEQWRWRLKQPLPVLPYRVQYHQADYDFMLELLSEFNLHFMFENSVCILSDYLDIKTTTHHVESPQPYNKKVLNKFLGYHFEKASQTGLFFATIEAPDTTLPYLNQDGHYRIRWDFDKTSIPLEGSSPVPLLMPHFMHFPLRKDTRVAVRCREGKMHQPVLMGVVPDTNPLPENYVHESYCHHGMILNPEKILLTHGNQKNSVMLWENSSISVPSGIFEIRSGKNTLWNIHENHKRVIKREQIISVNGHQVISAHHMDFLSGRNVNFSASQQLTFHASEKIDFKCKTTQLSTENISVKADQILDITASESMTILSETVDIQAQIIQLQSSGAMMSMTSGGVIFNTPVLMVNALQISGIEMP